MEAATWDAALVSVDCIVHCTVRAHVMRDREGLSGFRPVNVEGTQRLAQAAATQGIRRNCPLIIPAPLVLLRLLAKIAGKSEEVDRLLRNLIVDDTATRARLRWSPPVSVNEGIRRIFESISHD